MGVLITGHRGFVGGWALKLIPDSVGLDDAQGEPIDLLDVSGLSSAIARIAPTSVLHLAAQSSVPESFANPTGTFQTNLLGTQNLLTCLKSSGFAGRMLFVSTAEVYGSNLGEDSPTDETVQPLPLNPYAVSKLATEALCSYWQRVEGLDLVIARPFNHIGPGQSTRFAIADFAHAIAEIKLGRREPVLSVGDLEVTRDFTDVRDVIAAYQALLEKGQAGNIYNVCSGIEQNVRLAVEALAELAGVAVTVRVDPTRLRKSGQKRACGSPNKLMNETSWKPMLPWRRSLQDILNDWEEKLQ